MEEDLCIDNFTFNLSKQTILLAENAKLSNNHALVSWTLGKPKKKSELLDLLTELVCDKDICKFVGKLFTPILAELVGRAIVRFNESSEKRALTAIKMVHAWSILLLKYPYLIDICGKFILECKNVLLNEKDGAEQISLQIETFYNLLKFDSSMFFSLVNWDIVIRVAETKENEKVKFKAIHCLLFASDYSDKSSLFPDQLFEEFKTKCFHQDDYCSNIVIEEKSQAVAIPVDIEEINFTSSDIQTNLTAIANVLIPTNCNYIRKPSGNLIMTKGSFDALQGIILSLTTGTPVLLEGGLGTGKTVLLEHLASMVGRLQSPDVLKLQLGDQTDSKSIVGMHVCAETPGEFRWQPGTLTQAVQNGSWLILEDIDSAPLDVISVLSPLMESRSLAISGQSKVIKAAPGFQLFLTRRIQKGVGGYYRQSSPSSAIEHFCSVIHLEMMTKEELEHIASQKHPHLMTIIPKLVDVYCMISSDLNLKSTQDTSLSKLPSDKRHCTSRDFFKWCQRIAERTVNAPLISINADVFEEAFSCFCVPVASSENRLIMSHAIGTKFGMSREKIDFYFSRYKPQVQQTKLTFGVGRVFLPKIEQFDMKMMKISHSSNYAFTRHSLSLLEQIAVCVTHNEPVLLVGETGCGKTATIQYLANQCGHNFSAINMSQQSDVTDLLGGFKPVDTKQILAPLREKFESLFIKTFSEKQNIKFLGHIQQCSAQKKWDMLLKLMLHCKKAALQRKGIKKDFKDLKSLIEKWKEFGLELKKVQSQLNEDHALAFMFVEGGLIKAIRDGDWVLLDEINLATAETLECLSGLLESKSGSIVLVERGDAEPVRRHENFRLFACMNPATDVGKKDLPFGIRNRFSEIYVDELNDVADLKVLVAHYLEDADVTSPLVDGIVKFYQLVQQEAKEKLKDGTGHRPHYSLRTLCRALEYAVNNSNMMLPRAIYEGFCLSFLSQLDRSSHPVVESMIRGNIFGQVANFSSILSQPIPVPGKASRFCKIEGYWIERGTLPIKLQQEYVMTSSVKENLRDLARVVSGRKYPVLLQGETSVGKTSLINYLAKSTGNQCVRINNHEHTDIQEYIGCYSADANGKLVFKDGLLVDAMRKGYWIILDELNLAPTDVLEALNRLLDDNRELFVAETQETIKAHPQFVLFATQNPPGQYGGRKILSRAFRNRFVELHFDEIPSKELEIILHKRCQLPQSYCKKFVAVMRELQTRRKLSGIFAGKHGFITLRDLFRWAERYSQAPENTTRAKFYDWDTHIAEDGYMLLAGRCRKPEEADLIKETIEKIMKRKIDLELLYGSGSLTTKALLRELDSVTMSDFRHLVWTSNLRRMAVLVGRAMQFNEPILLVGETGCGKTTVCQLFSHLRNSKLYSINCHMHTESSDFIGGLRPVRHRENEDELKLFEWCNGPLVCAMKDGSSILIDEISLADDSVLERLNSVLETEKTLVLAEKGGSDEDQDEDIEIIVAHENFRLMATMNPGGDFGKKELSPALRNRFTEIWCPQSENREDFVKIINHNIVIKDAGNFGELMVNFIEWFRKTEAGQRVTISIRDLLCWVDFINTVHKKQTIHGETQLPDQLSPDLAFIHGAFLVFIDSIGTGSSWSGPGFSLHKAREVCLAFLKAQTGLLKDFDQSDIIWNESRCFGISPFFIQRGPLSSQSAGKYSLKAKTTCGNTLRLLRALQLPRPILLEGSPGVGKTSLVTAVARVSGNELVRINLSEQTDVTDLFGADLPVEGGRGGEFAWRDGPFLKALKAGQWVVLDELNLASQSVLEGLNACFDHRAEIFVPELGKTFQVEHEKTRIFACQNPLSQGGGRKGLPKSFLNRFTKVYIDSLKEEDLGFIITALHPGFDENTLFKMIHFNTQLQHNTMVAGEWGRKGSPWEFNIRDIIRWCELINKHQNIKNCDPSEFLNLIYEDRMRTLDDKQKVLDLYSEIFQDGAIESKTMSRRTQFSIGVNHVQIGHSILARNCKIPENCNTARNELQLLRKQIPNIETVMKCIEMNWMAILVGPKACGKTSVVESIAYLTGNTLNTLAMNSNMDTTELLGGFEQVNLSRDLANVLRDTESLIDNLMRQCIKSSAISNNLESCKTLLNIKKKLKVLEETHHAQEGPEDGKSITIFDELESQLFTLEEMAKNNDNLASVRKSFDDLKKRFIEEGSSMHAKGQFEWVDGVLIDTMKQGHWLLIENVNFCSPSVLDRLNGLLEPNGVLSVDERGVQNGEIPTVRPHPNFRLFLAMDPKYGEISRAMRNRGIEIYIPGEEDKAPYQNADKMQLLDSVGLRVHDVKKAILQIYEDLLGHGLKIIITDFVKAARLVMELRNRGFEDAEAIRRACILSFTGSETEAELREKTYVIESAISSTFEIDEISDQAQETSINNHILPSIREYSEQSVLCRVQRDSLFVSCAFDDAQNIDLLLLGAKCFMERSTVNDWKYRLNLMADMWPKSNSTDVKRLVSGALVGFYDSALFAEISELFERACLASEDLETMKDISCDVRISGKMIQHVFAKSKGEDLLASFASLTCRMKSTLDRVFEHTKQQFILEGEDERADKSLLAISKKCQTGDVSQASLPHPVIELLHPFLSVLDAVTEHCFKQTSNVLTEEISNKLLFALKWRDRFWSLCIMSSSDSLLKMNFPRSLFSLHWKWIIDELIPIINDLMTESNQKSIEELEKIVGSVSARLNSGFQGVWKPAGGRLLYEQPSLFRSPEIYQIWGRLIALQDKMNLLNQLKSDNQEDMKIKLKCLACVNDKSQKLMLCFKNLHILSSKDSFTIEEITSLRTEADTLTNEESYTECECAASLTSDTIPQQEQYVNAELFPVFGKVEILSWLSCLRSFKQVNRASGETGSRSEVVKMIEKLNCFSQLKYYRDVWLLSALNLATDEITNNKIVEFPRQLVFWLRSYCHQVSQFKIHQMINTIQSKGLRSSVQSSVPQEEIQVSFNLFSNTSAYVVDTIFNKRMTKTTQNGNINDCFQWRISVKDIGETARLLATLKNYYWQHGGLIQQLPLKICSQILHDAIDMFDDVIDILASQDAVAHQQQVVKNDVERLNCLLLKLNDETLLSLELPMEIRDILRVVNLCLTNWMSSCRNRDDDEAAGFMKNVQLTGMLSASVGLLGFLLSLPKSPFDLVEEAKIKARYFENELQDVDRELVFRYDVEFHLTGMPRIVLLSNGEVNVTHLTSNSARVGVLLQRRDYLLAQINILRKQIALRPDPSRYDDLLNQLTHFQNNIGNSRSVMGMMHELNTLLGGASQGDSKNTTRFASKLKRMIEAWMTSTDHFIGELDKDFVLYQDITVPIKFSLNQMMTGFSFILSALEWHINRQQFFMRPKTVESLSPSAITSYLASFPICSSSKLMLPRDIANRLLSTEFCSGIKEILTNRSKLTSGLKPRLLHLALSHVIADKLLCKRRETTSTSVREILEEFCQIWLQFAEEKRIREAEEDSIYKFKPKSHCMDSDDAEMNEKQFTELFPSFNADFNDLMPKENLEDFSDQPIIPTEEELPKDQPDDISFVNFSAIHSDLKALCNEEVNLSDKRIIQNFMKSHREVMLLSSLDVVRCDPLLDSSLATSNLLFASLLEKKLIDCSSFELASHPFDIYHESNIFEAQKLVSLLAKFSFQVDELLNEFPEHPTLIQIKQIIERILSFPVDQPLMKFLTGLEILLKQSQDWETYASSKVSLSNHLVALTQQIIEWRKLELRCWPHLLQVLEDKFTTQANEWFLKIYSALNELLFKEDGDVSPEKEMGKLLQQFLESSSVGEFATRLDLIQTMFILMKNKCPNVATVLWNIYHYYKQFAETVNEYMRKVKSPIEKDLKDFVKIAKWKDINFWAVKQAAERSHRTLHKFVRKYQDALMGRVIDHLKLQNGQSLETPLNHGFQLDKKLLHDTNRFKSSEELPLSLSNVTSVDDWLNSTSSLSVKLIKKCVKYMKKAKHTSMIEAINEFTGDIIGNVKDLQSVDIHSLPEEKRAQARKHLHARKRKALATLFKTLSTIGLSYRKGLALALQEDAELDILSPVIELKDVKDKGNELFLLTADCHQYYFKCLARNSALHNAMRNPSKELTPQDIARSRGNSYHLIHVVQAQRKILKSLLDNYESISSKVNVLKKIIDSRDVSKTIPSLLPQQDITTQCMIKVKDMLDLTVYVMMQFRQLVKCCPDAPIPFSASPAADELLPTINNCSMDDDLPRIVLKHIEDILEPTSKSKEEIDKIIPFNDSVSLVTWSHVESVQNALKCLARNSDLLQEIEQSFTCQSVDSTHSSAKSISMLKCQTRDLLVELKNSNSYFNPSADLNNAEQFSAFQDAAKSLFKRVLVCIQELSKLDNEGCERVNEIAEEKEQTEHQEDESDEEMDLDDGHLIPKLEKNFFKEVQMLGSNSIYLSLKTFFQKTKDLFDVAYNCGNEIFLIYTGLEQYLGIVKYYSEKLLYLHRTSCKLLYVLTGIFTDLATDGFCLPPDEVEASGEGATEFEDIQGGGVGEGEGMKDVSDQIESEDQLQEAQQEGKQKDEEKNEDREIPEEEEGIEMTDDFDGRMHDVDPDQEPNESESGNESEDQDPDDKMGDLNGIDEEKLDEKFWGDSDDEDNESGNEEEKGPGAEGKAESELVAKDENEGEQQGKDGNKNEQSEKDNENEVNELSADELNENDSEDGNEDEAGKEDRQINKNDDQQLEEFPPDLNMDGEDKSDADDDDDAAEDEKMKDEAMAEENLPEEEEKENVSEDGTTREDKNEEDITENQKDDVEDVNDTDKSGDEPMMDDENEEKSREDNNKQKENQDTLQSSDVQATSASVENATGDDSAMEAEITAEEQNEQQSQGTGSSQQLGSEGHDGISSVVKQENDGNKDNKKNRRKDYNKSRQDRSLATDAERKLKRLKTTDAEDSSKEDKEQNISADLYQHVREDESYDTHALDAATAEQALDQTDNKPCLEDSDAEMNSDDEEISEEQSQKEKTNSSSATRDPRLHEDKAATDEKEVDNETELNNIEEPMVDVDENKLEINSGFYTSKAALISMTNLAKLENDNEALRQELELQLSSWAASRSQALHHENVAIETWRKYENLTSALSQQLCEQLRLVLEPTLASKLRGDYRTGKRLNMRKVIPYIASQFRKDKIWLRRTKKSRRQYQIMLAVDDSSSMADNHSKQLAFESLAVISNALTWLEAGELAVCSFGETTKLLHSFNEPFNEQAGAHVLEDFTFEQKKTKVALMLDTCSTFMTKERSNVLERSSRRLETSQLLLIVSDGRGIFLEGKEVVERSVRRAREAGLFIVFIILDNPSNRDSVLDIKVPIFKPGGLMPEIKSYLEEFPFPFYLILRDINSLPIVLSDALRQWFELVTSMT